MMRWLVASSLRFRYLVLALAAGLVYFGLDQLRQMPVDVFPEFAPPMVEIQTISIGLSPAEVESLVTVPLEQSLAGIPNLDVMRSKSVPQLSSVKMIFKSGTDLQFARQMVQERVKTVMPQMPTSVAPPFMLPPLSSTSRTMKIGLSSKTLSVIDLSMITYWTIRQRLLRVPGVANIAIWGERLEMLQVQVVPEWMKKHGVTMEEIKNITADSLDSGLYQFSDGHIIGTGGWVETPNQRLPVRHVLPTIYKSTDLSPALLEDIPIKQGENGPIYIKDVAKVVIDHQPMVGDGIINDDIGLLLIVEKFPWANTLSVTRGVEAAIDTMRPGLPDIDIDTAIFRPATFIEMSIDNLSTAMLIAALLVVVVLYAFLYEWRVTLISCIAIPLSLVAAGLVLYYRGTTINTMVLAGFVVALGAVVDDAIVYVENITRRLRQNRVERTGKPPAAVIIDALMEIRGAIVIATMIIALTVVPVFFMGGLSGAFFEPLALSYAISLLASLVVALTVTPALAYLLLAKAPVDERESPLIQWLRVRYDSMLRRTIQAPRKAYSVAVAILVAGLVAWPFLGQSLLPSFKERDFLMHWLTKPGTSWPEMNRITIQGSKELREIEGVQNFGAHIGQALIMDEVVGMYFGENWVSVDPSVDYDKTVAKIQETVDGYPGLFRDVLTYLKERIREVLTGTSEAIVIRIYGDDLDTMHHKASEVRDALAGIEGIIDLHVELHENIPHIQVQVDLEKARFYGIKPGDVRRAAATIVAGEEAGDIHIAQRTYDVQVWSVPSARNSLTDIRQMLIDVPAGGVIQLQDVARVEILPTPNTIEHEGLKRKIDVGANVRGRDLGSVYRDVERALAGVKFPEGYYPELLGEYVELQKSRTRLIVVSLIVGLGVFLLLHAAFKSVRLTIISCVALPAALTGGILAAVISGGVISLGSLVGFLTVFGIAARNGILLFNHYQHLEDEEGMPFGLELVLRGARERLAPILMTAITTGLALLPLVVAGQIPGHEIEHPMATVILGGLVTSTVLNLFIMPILYLHFGSTHQLEPTSDRLATV